MFSLDGPNHDPRLCGDRSYTVPSRMSLIACKVETNRRNPAVQNNPGVVSGTRTCTRQNACKSAAGVGAVFRSLLEIRPVLLGGRQCVLIRKRTKYSKSVVSIRPGSLYILKKISFGFSFFFFFLIYIYNKSRFRFSSIRFLFCKKSHPFFNNNNQISYPFSFFMSSYRSTTLVSCVINT